MRLKDKVAVITGGSSGLGKATALLFAKEGAKVGVLSRDPDETRQAAQAVARHGEAIPLIADISKAGDMQNAYQQVLDQWGRLDIVFANAGINGLWAPIENLEPDEWEKTIAINLTGTFLTIKYAVPHMKSNGGSIIVTSSVNGTRMFSNTGATAYATSKAGQVALTKMLALELAKHRIRVNVICPGAFSTEIEENTEREDLKQAREPAQYPAGIVPLTDGKPGDPKDVAELVLFLGSDASRHITGTPIWIDGAESLLQG